MNGKKHWEVLWGVLFFVGWVGGLWYWGTPSADKRAQQDRIHSHPKETISSKPTRFVYSFGSKKKSVALTAGFQNTHVHVTLVWLGKGAPTWELKRLKEALPKRMSISLYEHTLRRRDIPAHMAVEWTQQKQVAWQTEPLLSWLAKKRLPRTSLVLAVSNEELLSTQEKGILHPVMGLADYGGPAAIISSRKILDVPLLRMHKRRMWIQLALHEIGHVLGYKHCNERRCVMYDAHGSNRALLQMGGRLCRRCLRRNRGNTLHSQ
ncbi:MAG: hypothetical protein CL920_33930 [Deltaproteobacteria bacterium]|nr:hypothetical protein [Deltaproteobacteria bacterium]MBU53722.1 hypothetical protein [Deltaproteobacteria bacterium]